MLDFADVLLAGLARDGGLYVPEAWPALCPTAGDAADAPYADVAVEVMWPFVEGRPRPRRARRHGRRGLRHLRPPRRVPAASSSATGSGCSSCSTGRRWRSRTSPCSSSAGCSTTSCARGASGSPSSVATSGDTGSAAIEACVGPRPPRHRHPAPGRPGVSDVQRRQMTTVDAPNVHNVAVEGTFDDCQDLVKALFADDAVPRRASRLSAMNSINWARVMAQIVYYVTGRGRGRAGRARCAFAVPTGNFGNVFAGWVRPAHGRAHRAARRRHQPQRHPHPLGRRPARWSPSEVVPDAQPEHGHPGVVATSSACCSSCSAATARRTAELMRRFRPRLGVGRGAAGDRDVFAAARLDDDETLRGHRRPVGDRTGYLVDPHTAVGLGAAARLAPRPGPCPIVCLATAHPAKFPDAVEEATGVAPRAARAPGRPVRPARALRRRRQRPRRGAGARSAASPLIALTPVDAREAGERR